MLLCLNQSTADSDSVSSVQKSFILLYATAVVLSFTKSECSIHKQRSLRNILNRSGPSMETCGTL